MQESAVDEQNAERVGPSWYLSRDGQQLGPLTDRELSLFAEGGNFRPGDLLWTAGLDSWKSADAVFGLPRSPDADATEDFAVEGLAAEGLEDGDFADEGLPDEDFADTGHDAVAVDTAVGEDALSLPADPADAVFSVPAHDAERESHAGIAPNHADVDALVQALTGQAAPPATGFKDRVFQEFKAFAGTLGYLWVVFALLMAHAWAAGAQTSAGLGFYALTTINAFGVFKLLPLIERLPFVQQLKQKPLVYPIAYETVLFTALLFAAYTLETVLLGWMSGSGNLASAPDLGGGLAGTLALWLVLCVALLPYFAFKAFERAVGADMIAKLLLGAR